MLGSSCVCLHVQHLAAIGVERTDGELLAGVRWLAAAHGRMQVSAGPAVWGGCQGAAVTRQRKR